MGIDDVGIYMIDGMGWDGTDEDDGMNGGLRGAWFASGRHLALLFAGVWQHFSSAFCYRGSNAKFGLQSSHEFHVFAAGQVRLVRI
jgi:hypothetical protein